MDKQIIFCRECGNQLRIPSDKHIRFTCPFCKKEYQAINGMLINSTTNIKTDDAMNKNKKKRNIWILATIIVVIALIVFGIRFRNDYRDYHKFLSSENIRDYYAYKNEHRWGVYKKEAADLKNKIWDKMIVHYDSIAGTGDRDKKAVDFFKTVLHFMKENDVNDIYVKFDSTTVLTNFSDFPDSIKSICLSFYSSEYSDIKYYSPPDDSNTINIREHFSSGKLEQLQEIVYDGLTTTFSTVFGSDFISVKPMEKDNPEAKVIITIKYLISDAYRKGYETEIPRILPYVENNIFFCNVPGVSIDFKGSKIDIPASNKTYKFGSKQDFEHKVFNVRDIEDAYGQLTHSCFKSFVNNFSTQFGLFNFEKFDKQALSIVYNILSQNGVFDDPEIQKSNTPHEEKEKKAASILEKVRNSWELFMDPQLIKEDSAVLASKISRYNNAL